MKRIIVVLALLTPALGLIYFWLQPQADISANVPIFHFYVVTFTTFSAAVISLLLTNALGQEAKTRHVLAAAAFGVIGSVFFSHGLATPGALISHSHPAVEWSAWLTLFGGGALFAAAALDGPLGPPRWLPVRRLVFAAMGAVLAYSAVAAFAPDWLTFLDQQFSARFLPWHRLTIFALTLGLWLFATARLWLTWRASRSRVDGVLAFVAFWLATATVSMHLFPVWNLSWWLYHATLLVGFLVTVVVLAAEYEQVRQFSLARYYLALSLIVTALLALAASALFTQFSYLSLVSEIESTSSSIANNLSSSLMRDLPDMATPEDIRRLSSRPGVGSLISLRLTSLPIGALQVIDTAGVAAYASDVYLQGVRVQNRAAFEAALDGQTTVFIRQPGDSSASYSRGSSVHVIETTAPLRPGGKTDQAPVGVLVTLEDAADLGRATESARVTGLVTAAVTMGLLFVALLSVVGRADRIITQRTRELNEAYSSLRKLSARLQTYSEWLLGRDLLGRVLDNPDALSLMRRERTVLFIDIRGFTRWTEVRTPEEVVAMLNRYYDIIDTVVNRHQVIKFKFAADEAMAVFPDAQRAVAAAAEMRTEIDQLLAGEQLGAGIGLHTGPLVEGLLGSTEVKFYDVIGDTVNTAKRIESAAGNAEALVSADTLQAAGDALTVGPARQISAKGKEAPVTVYPLN